MSRDPIASAQSVIREALAESSMPCFTCSFQAEDAALLHLLAAERPEIPVLFLETGYHFAAVTEYRDRLAREWKLNLVNLEARQSVEEQEAEFGLLYQSNPNECCARRKVEPLMRGLAGHDLWFTGLRREQSPTRANLQPREIHKFPDGRTLAKASPLFDWTSSEVFAYLAANDIPVLSLYSDGYTSIGCEPCTAKPEAGAHARSGRWGGAKLECGLHTVSVKEG
jgi:phosphoadenosine phosphosulfate reductase